MSSAVGTHATHKSNPERVLVVYPARHHAPAPPLIENEDDDEDEYEQISNHLSVILPRLPSQSDPMQMAR
jgi:hypothetical protein